MEQALRRGRLLLQLIPLLLFIICFIAPMLLVATEKISPVWLVGAGFATGLALAWLWWAVAITHWRIWSLGRVRNIHELHAVAVQEKLIWRKGHWAERTEIRTRAQRETLMALKARLAIPDERLDDPGVPATTAVGYSKGQSVFLCVFGGVLIGFAAKNFRVSKGNEWVVAIMAAVGAWLLIDGLRKLLHRSPVLVVDQQGITLRSKRFHAWGGIHNERVIVKGSGRSTRHLLVFDHPGGEAELDIGPLAISKGALRHALKIHRLRWEKGRTTL